MAIWARILDSAGSTASGALSAILEAIRTVFAGDPETRRKVAFSVAMIALSAKMAKADGVVTHDEVAAFQQIFEIPEAEAGNVARLYNLAKRDVAGYRFYAERLAALCRDGRSDCAVLEDIVDGLFHIAKADGLLHDKELAFLADIAAVFGIDEERFAEIAARHVRAGDVDPYKVLGLSPDTDFQAVRKRYRQLAAENHPDRLTARGVPEEFLAIANRRMAALNDAYRTIVRERQPAT